MVGPDFTSRNWLFSEIVSNEACVSKRIYLKALQNIETSKLQQKIVLAIGKVESHSARKTMTIPMGKSVFQQANSK